MTPDNFKSSLAGKAPPAGLSPAHCARYGGPATTTGTKRIGSSWTKTAGIVPGCTPIFTVSKGIWITPVIGIAKHTISQRRTDLPRNGMRSLRRFWKTGAPRKSLRSGKSCAVRIVEPL